MAHVKSKRGKTGSSKHATKRKPGRPRVAVEIPKDFPPKVRAALAVLPLEEQQFVATYCGVARGNGRLTAQLLGVRGDVFVQANWASHQLRHAAVRSAIEAWMQAFAITPSEITERITDLAQVNIGPFFEVTSTGRLQLRKKIDPIEFEKHKHWIKSVKMDGKGHILDLELHSSVAALRELAKINKMYSDAPIFTFHLHLSQLSDAELLRQLEEARNQEIGPLQPRLPPPPDELPGVEVPPAPSPV